MEQPLATTSKVGFIAVRAEDGELKWTTVANLSGCAVSLVGWTLHSEGNEALRLTGMLEPGDTKRINCDLKLFNKGTVRLMNGAGELIDKFTHVKDNDDSQTNFAVHNDDGVASNLQILCAMVNAIGDESENEFVVLANASKTTINLVDYKLSDCKHSPISLTGILQPGESQRISRMYDQSTGVGVALNNRRGSIKLLGKDGNSVDEVTYVDKRDARIEEGVPVSFHLDWDIPAVVKVPQTPLISERELNILPIVEQPKNGLYYTPLRYVLPVVAVALALCKICKAYKRRARAAA